ncbi:two-component system response regulator [Ammoniphilus sp. 3BR4]|uniref:response regulator n=1 Tax=Ammoniphilus sp. 3BR4 TaxID=3158265 RepID=UPI003465E3CD
MSSEGKVNILLVDDRPENLLALEAIIEREDYQLIKASSGEEALKLLLKYDFATILLDVQMPGIDGFETAKIIKAREKSKNILLIFVTANNLDSQHIFNGYFVGAIDYILKPFDSYILKAKVQGFVDLYKMNLKLVQQTEGLIKKTIEVEKAYKELSVATS